MCGLSGAARAGDLAPTGTLRAAFLATNPVHARIDARTGEITGPVVDLVAELAKRLHVPFKMIPAANASAVIGHINAGTADVGFLAYEASRAQEVDFAGGFALMFNTYLVRAASPLQRTQDADRTALQIGAVKGQTQELYLSHALKQARLRVFDTMPETGELQRMLVGGEVDAFAVNQQRAIELAAGSRNILRALPDSFLSVEQSFVVRKGDKESADMLDRLVEELKASGFIKASLDRAKLTGVGVAPKRGR